MSEPENYNLTHQDDQGHDSYHRHAHHHSPYNMDVIASLIELQIQRRTTDNELGTIKENLEESINSTKEHFRDLEASIAEIKTMARDAMTVSVGIDGKNGLRGSIEKLSRDFSTVPKDIEFLKQTASSYLEVRSLLIKLFTTSFAFIVIQFGTAVWYVSQQHAKQEVIREDLNKVLNYIEKKPLDNQGYKQIK